MLGCSDLRCKAFDGEGKRKRSHPCSLYFVLCAVFSFILWKIHTKDYYWWWRKRIFHGVMTVTAVPNETSYGVHRPVFLVMSLLFVIPLLLLLIAALTGWWNPTTNTTTSHTTKHHSSSSSNTTHSSGQHRSRKKEIDSSLLGDSTDCGQQQKDLVARQQPMMSDMLSMHIDPVTGKQRITHNALDDSGTNNSKCDANNIMTKDQDTCSSGSTRDITFSEENQHRLHAKPPIPFRLATNKTKNSTPHKDEKWSSTDDKNECSFMKNGKPHCTRTNANGQSYNPCPPFQKSNHSIVTHENQAVTMDDFIAYDAQGNTCEYKEWKDIKGTCQGACDGKARKRQKRKPKHPGQGCKTQYREVPCIVGTPCKCHEGDLSMGNNIKTCSGTKCKNASSGDQCMVGCQQPKQEVLLGPNKFTCVRGKWETNNHSTLTEDQPIPTCSSEYQTCPDLRGDMRYHISSTYKDDTDTGPVYKPSICVQARKGDYCHIFCRNGYTSQGNDPQKPGDGMLLKCSMNSSTGKMYWSPTPDEKCKCTPCDANGNPGKQHKGDMCCPNPDG